MADLKPLIDKYDCFAWVPTIRGALSLDLIDNSRNLLGDVDKYSVAIRHHKGLTTEHYIAATSLLTVNDRKRGKGICRTFRYIFTGSIHNPAADSRLLDETGLKDNPELRTYLATEGALTGRVTIIAELTDAVRDSETAFLCEMKNLTELSHRYRNDFAVEAKSLGELEASRKTMVDKWHHLTSLISQIENDDKNYRPTYIFDVFLTRDGILLLKNRTGATDNESFAKKGSADDYTIHVPVHRIFKCAMNYVKYLFHSNYHHNSDHDTYLPASNIHPAKASGTLNLDGVFRHQLNAFLYPVIRLKRNGFNDYTIDGNGVILYAKSFIKVCERNEVIDQRTASESYSFLDIQAKEIDHMTQQRRSILNSILAQRNIIFIASGVLAFAVAILKIANTFIDFEPATFDNLSFEKSFHKCAILIVILLIGYLMFELSHSFVLRKQFKHKNRKRSFLMKDSNLQKGQLSSGYKLFRKYQDMCLWLKQKGTQWIFGVILAVAVAMVIKAIVRLMTI
ncbi:MAG: hypothetical protein K2L90_04150 [Muribaculaceae bacterium]|nr:hypothetical protein [Muribaculaceae bacterium]